MSSLELSSRDESIMNLSFPDHQNSYKLFCQLALPLKAQHKHP